MSPYGHRILYVASSFPLALLVGFFVAAVYLFGFDKEARYPTFVSDTTVNLFSVVTVIGAIVFSPLLYRIGSRWDHEANLRPQGKFVDRDPILFVFMVLLGSASLYLIAATVLYHFEIYLIDLRPHEPTEPTRLQLIIQKDDETLETTPEDK